MCARELRWFMAVAANFFRASPEGNQGDVLRHSPSKMVHPLSRSHSGAHNNGKAHV